jgi:hypothetical protein
MKSTSNQKVTLFSVCRGVLMKITWGMKEIAASGSTLKKAKNTVSESITIAKYVYAERNSPK